MEYEINLENLIHMKRVFEEADEDGSGELDPDEFYEKLGPYLGQSLSQAEVAQLFMRIDADCGGTIDWEEFVNYFFLQRAASGGCDGSADWRLHPQDHWRKEWRGARHKEPAERVYCCPAPLDSYITAGHGGQLRVWAGGDLAPRQTLANGPGWVTDCLLVDSPAWRKLVVAAQDRTITFYDPVRSSFEYSSRLTCPGTMGPPQCLAELQREAGAPLGLLWGDTEGAVMLLKGEPPPLHSERPLAPRKDYEVLHSGHSDWVTRVEHIPDVGLVSSSLDATLAMLDLKRRKLVASVGLHRKPVRTFGYSPTFSLVASGGVERSVLLWQPKGNVNRKVGELAGHSAGVSQLVVADEQSQVITLSDDHVVRVWDLRNHKCVQALGRQDWLRPEDSKPSAIAYDSSRRRLVCASHRPAVLAHRPVEVDRTHDSRLVAALYNATFSGVVSGDEGGTIVLWNLSDGRRAGGFSLHATPASAAGGGATTAGATSPSAASKVNGGSSEQLTAMAFDAAQRRLLTATDAGRLRAYNFNSGAVLREFREGGRRRGSRQHEGGREITAVAFVAAAGPQTAAQQAADEGGEECSGEPADEQQESGGQQECSGRQAPAQQPPVDLGAAGSTDGYSELSEHALLSMQAQRASQAHAAAAEASAAGSSGGSESGDGGAAPNLVLATGWCRALCVWEEGEERVCEASRLLPGHAADVLSLAPLGAHVAATGDFEGEVRVWHLLSGTCLAAFSYGGAQFERTVRKLCWLPGGSGATHWPLLVACGEDGGMQVWAVELPASVLDGSSPLAAAPGEAADTLPAVPCRLLARVAAAHRPQDCISAACVGQAADGSLHIWAGDSSGHVALWDLSGLAAAAACGGSSPAAQLDAPPAATPAATAVPRRLAHWRATEAAIASLDPLAPGKGLLLVGAQDASVSVWTQAGGLVGVFGKHSWDLAAPDTWQDPQALVVPPPLPLDSGGSGLTPRELIASTPRRSSWVVRSGSCLGSGAATARRMAGGSASGSAAGSALPSARSLHGRANIGPSGAPQEHSAGLVEGQAEQAPASTSGASRPPPLEGLAEALSSLAQLRLPIAEEPGEGSDGQDGASASFAASAGAASGQQGKAAPPAAAEPAVDPATAPNPAGARLAALAAEAAARKADRWAVPVHVQAHSALALQRMEAVPTETADMWAAVKASGKASGYSGAPGREAAARAASPSLPHGRRSSAAAPSLAAIMGRSSGSMAYQGPWRLSACGWWFKRLCNSRDETSLHMDVFDKLLDPRKHTGSKDSIFVCDEQLGKQYTMAVNQNCGLASNRRQALLQGADFRAWLEDSGAQPGDFIALKRQDERLATLAAQGKQNFLEQALSAFQAAAVQADAGGMLRPLKLLALAGRGGSVLQGIIKQWYALLPDAQRAVFNAALIAAAEGSWAELAEQLQLALDVAGA
ncbi:WD repeat-containing on Y chromosome-like [Chlorella sorokiniana]|uniref:WD repeat-containing on Y chromosome-like n=1 Tax=Chlorella sorokiniana TaxID=3076 RepID=A0A2P6TB30_CHLSO|nr:WD repeat-containing on Y chromosome-like [Chlorella sorokiniana]|eukprot:PRW05751.1 WD repeat-containing on Y chromosome-like [Chlorella sorokiniana]